VEALAMIATLPKASVVIGQTLCVVALLILCAVVFCALVHVVERAVERLEHDRDRPLLLVLESSPESIGDILQRLRTRMRGLLETIARRLRPSAPQVDVQPEADGDDRARTRLGTNDAEARAHQSERSAVFEVDAARGARSGLEVRGADVGADAASNGTEGSDSVGHIENVGRESAGGNGA
jgi:hypothetical protein